MQYEYPWCLHRSVFNCCAKLAFWISHALSPVPFKQASSQDSVLHGLGTVRRACNGQYIMTLTEKSWKYTAHQELNSSWRDLAFVKGHAKAGTNSKYTVDTHLQWLPRKQASLSKQINDLRPSPVLRGNGNIAFSASNKHGGLIRMHEQEQCTITMSSSQVKRWLAQFIQWLFRLWL